MDDETRFYVAPIHAKIAHFEAVGDEHANQRAVERRARGRLQHGLPLPPPERQERQRAGSMGRAKTGTTRERQRQRVASLEPARYFALKIGQEVKEEGKARVHVRANDGS